MIANVLWAFVPIAVVVTITPGAATAMVVRSAMRGGVRAGACARSPETPSASSSGRCSRSPASPRLVAASEVAFVALKVTGALVLVGWGIQSFRRAGTAVEALEPRRARAFRDGLVTSLANPKLAVFFVALFAVRRRSAADVLPTTLAMAAMIVCFDVLWYSTLALLASRAKAGFMASHAGRWLERGNGTVLIALGVRVALD